MKSRAGSTLGRARVAVSSVITATLLPAMSLVALLLPASCGGSSEAAKDPAADQKRQEFLNRPPPAKSVEVKNSCESGVPVYIGETPNGSTGDHVVLRGGGTSHFPRNPDGTFTIWLVDDKGFGLAKVHVTKRMSHVEIGASCKTIDAN